LAAIAAGLLLFVGLRLTPWFAAPAQAMTVQLASFSRIGAEVPETLPAVLREELRGAFGTDNAIVVQDRDASFALRGVVRKAGDQLRYAIELNQVHDGEMLWSASIDRPVVEGELTAKQVASMTSWIVRCGLSRAGEHEGKLSSRALSLYLQHGGWLESSNSRCAWSTAALAARHWSESS
jgi:hypothetical protein